jgi:carbonic anhydrase
MSKLSICNVSFRCALPLYSLALLGACSAPPVQTSAPAPEPPAVKEATPPSEPAAEPAPVSARPVHWGYTSTDGPAKWAELSPAYAACASGQAQSPIDIVTKNGPMEPASWKANYGKTALHIAHHEHVDAIVDNGHTIQVTVDEGSILTTAKNEYELLQFHFHTPSENTLNGKHFPMEMHMVHRAKDGSFAVVAAFFEKGGDNPRLAQLIQNFPAKKGEAEHHADVSIDLQTHLPPQMTAHGFVGSFTTPPCTENVEWIVLAQPIKAGASQLAAFAARLNENNRPVQPLNGRALQTAQVSVAK